MFLFVTWKRMALAQATPTIPAPTMVTLFIASLVGSATLHRRSWRRQGGRLINQDQNIYRANSEVYRLSVMNFFFSRIRCFGRFAESAYSELTALFPSNVFFRNFDELSLFPANICVRIVGGELYERSLIKKCLPSDKTLFPDEANRDDSL